MLSSEIALASQTSLSLSSSLAPSAIMLQSTRRFPRRLRTNQQIRSFRFGVWSVCLDPTLQKEPQYRHRISRHKYNELLSRGVSWDPKSPKSSRHLGLKGFICSSWQRQDTRPSGRYTKTATPNGVDRGQRKGTHTRTEGEWGDFEHLFHERAVAGHFRRTTNRLFSSFIFPFDIQEESGVDAKPTSVSKSSSNGKDNDLDYVIDPITNRKVFVGATVGREDSTRKAIPIPGQALEDYQSQSEGFAPPISSTANEANGKAYSAPDTYDDGFKAYDAQMSYDKPFTAYEPDGQPPSWNIPDPVQEGLKSYDSKAAYDKPFTAYEPDGRPPTQEQIDPVQEGLKAYDAIASYDKPFLVHGEDINCSMRHNGGPGQEENPDPVQEGLKAYDEKMSYDKPFVAYEPDGRPPVQEPLDTMQKGLAEFDSEMSYDKPFAAYEPDGQAPPSRGRLDPVREAVEGYYGSKDKIKGSCSYKTEPNEKTPVHWSSDNHATSGLPRPSKNKSKAERRATRRKLDQEFGKAHANPGSITEEEAAAIEKIKQVRKLTVEVDSQSDLGILGAEQSLHASPQKMTGNFVQDFPEDFKATWVATRGEPESLLPKKKSTQENYGIPTKGLEQTELDGFERTVQEAERKGVDDIVSHEALSKTLDSPKIQPSLDRSSPRSDGINEMRAATRPSEQENKEIKRTESLQDIAPGEAIARKPTLYKILAYDPTMQSISIAETTSIVPDSAQALTPAEVLLRLSNPTKFMPHFEPLQSQGYEIVSGSGDILVFRHVRDGPPSETSSAPLMGSRELKRTARNPIDGMYPVVATGNFASPTGFVNLDFPEPPEPEPAFKSNVDVRREEPVFSGKRNWEDEDIPKTKTTGKGKRLLIGGVWVAGCSYAIGVVAEYFRTGGIDGMGPQGF